jgi:hypothetical protein
LGRIHGGKGLSNEQVPRRRLAPIGQEAQPATDIGSCVAAEVMKGFLTIPG